ncbi:RNA polymerase sigma factor [Streptomyces sp. NPDC088762]|uniref:RNA polymerase sigma factor n=1 Tax=Streptomyces sp. NPDC088762 TaxID=3365891 RepID=UPI0037FB0ACB
MQNAERSGEAADETEKPEVTAPHGAAEMSEQVEAARNGDEAAFGALFRAVQPGLLRYLTVLVGADAEDVASETWLQIARDLGSFRGDFDGFRGWAATIGRNRAMDLLRAQRRRPVSGVPAEDLLRDRPTDDDTEASALATVDTTAALALIATLPRDQAEAVLLRVVMDLDAETAARVLGKRAGAVRMASHRGLRKLAARLAGPRRRRGTAPEPDPVPGPEPATGAATAADPPATPEKFSAQGVTPTTARTLKGMR